MSLQSSAIGRQVEHPCIRNRQPSMVQLSENLIRSMRNFQLRMEIEDLHNAYRASLQGLIHREGEIEAAARAELGLGPADEWPERNDFDPDDPIGELYERSADLDAQAKRGAPMVRKAFLIALFHAWERHCNARLKPKTYHPHDVNQMLWRDGRGAVCDEIETMQLAANCAKHGPGTSAKALFRKRADLFQGVSSDHEASDSKLRISDEVLVGFFAAVREASR